MFSVLKTYQDNSYPIKTVLRNGRSITLKNRFQTTIITRRLENFFEIENDLLLIKMKNLPTIKLYDWEENGDKFGVFYNQQYLDLPVKDKEVIDIGANIGDSALYFAVRGAKKIIALEPHPSIYQSGLKNVVENGFETKINFIMAGANNKNEFVFIDENSPLSCGLSLKKNNKGIKVPLLSLEKILEHCETNSCILKIDCEGCEYSTILSASEENLKRFSHIQIEFHFGYQNLKTKLEKNGFKVTISKLRLDKNKKTKETFYIGNLFAKK